MLRKRIDSTVLVMPKNTVDFPEPTYDRVRTAAAADRRSLASEIVVLVEEALDARDATPRSQRRGQPPSRPAASTLPEDYMSNDDGPWTGTALGHDGPWRVATT